MKTANNSFVDAEGSGTITFYVDRPNAKPAKIFLEHFLYVAACGTNNLLSIIQLLQRGVNFDFKLVGVTTSLGSVLVYEAPLINSLFVLKATAAAVSEASAAVDDPPSTTPSTTQSTTPSSVPETSEVFCNIRPAVDDMDILIYHALLGRLSLPAINRLPDAVRGIRLHAKSPPTCPCEACIMGKMFRKPFQPSEDKAKTRLLELIHSDVIGPMQTQTIRSCRYIIIFTDDHSRYSEVCLMKAKSEAPAKLRSMWRKWRSSTQSRRCVKLQLMGEVSMLVVRRFLSTWQRKASLGKYQPHTHSSRMAFRRDAIAQCWTQRGLC